MSSRRAYVHWLMSLVFGGWVAGSGSDAWAKPAIVQDNWGQHDGAGHAVCKWNKTINAGDLLIATVTYTGGTGTTIMPPVASGGGGTWTEIPTGHADNGTAIGVRMYYVSNATKNTTKPTESWTVSPSTAEVTLELHEFGGVLLAGGLDGASIATGSASPALVSTTPTATNASEMTFVVLGVQSAAATLGTPTTATSTSYSNITSAGTTPLASSATPTSTTTKTRSSYVLLTTSGTTVSATMTQTPAANWAAAIATFQLTEIHWLGAGSYPARPAMSPDPTVCYGFYDDDGCWSSTSGGPNNVASPGAADVVVFDSGGVGNVTSNPFGGGTDNAYSIEMKPSYSGTLTVTDRVGDNPDLKTAGPLLIEGGTLTLSTSQLQVVGVTTMNGTGAFNGASATETFGNALTITAGSMSLGPSPALTGNTQLGTNGSAATNGVLTLSSGTVTLPGTLTVDGAGSVFNAGTTNLTVTGKTVVDFGGTLNAGASGTKTFTSQVTLGTTAGLTAGTFNLNSATALFNSSQAVTLQGGSTFDASAGGALTFGTSVTAGVNAILLTNGTMNLSGAATTISGAGMVTVTVGTLTMGPGSTTFPGNLTVNGGMDAGPSTAITVNGNFAMTSGTFHAKSAALDLKGTTTLSGSSTFDAVAASVTLENNLTLSGTASLDLSNAAPSMTGGTVVINTGTTLKLAASDFTFPGTTSVSGALVDGNGARRFTGALTVSGTYTAGTGAHTFASTVAATGGTFDLTSAATLSFGDTLTVSNGTTTFGAQTVSLPALTVSGGTFRAGTSQLTVAGATNSGATMDMASAASLAFGGSFTLTSGTTTFGAQTITLPSLSILNAGTLVGGSGGLTVSGLTTITGGSVNLALATTGPTFTGAVSMNNGGLTLGAGTNAAMSSTFTMTGGTFNAGTSASAQLTIAGAVNINGTSGNHLSNFNANAGTLIFNGPMTVCDCTAAVGITGTFNSNTSTTTFNGVVTIGGSDGTRGRFHAQGATLSFAFPTTMLAPDSVLLQGASTTSIDTNSATPFPTLTFGANAIAGTNALDVLAGSLPFSNGTTVIFNPTGGAGNVTLAAGTSMTMTGNPTTFPQTVTIAGTLTGGSGALTFSGPTAVSGTFSGGSNSRVFSSTLSVSGAFTSSTGAHNFSGTVTNSAGTLDLHTASTATFNAGANLVVSGGTTTLGSYGGATTTVPVLSLTSGAFDVGTNGTHLTVTGTTTVSGGTANMASTRGIVLTGPVAVSAGALTLGSSAESLGSSLSVSGGAFTAGTAAVTIAGAVTVSGGVVTMGAGSEALQSTLDVPGGTFTAGAGSVTVTGATTVSAAGVLNGGASTNLRFNGPVTLGTIAAGSAGTFNGGTATTTFVATTVVQGASTFNVGSGTAVAFTGVFSLLGSSAFNGMTGSTTFTAAPTLTSGTFSLGSAGTIGIHTLSLGATFDNGVTLSFPSDKGELRLANGKTLTLNGPVTSAFSGTTLPKIDCNGCVSGIAIAFGATSTLNIDGLQFDKSVAAGVSIADGATYTLLKRLKFTNNVANSVSTAATHLAITSSNPGGTKLLVIPGCSFDATAQYNVTLSGVSGSTGVRAIFENQSAVTNGTRAGSAFDLDADTNGDNVADSVVANRYGAVVEWTYASPADTTGTAIGPPIPAFDLNTFAFYGIYASFKNTSGAGSSDRVWMRNADGSAGYFYDIPDASGDIVGNPRYDTVNETTAGLDVNGDGDAADTNVHVLYIGTSAGHIIKLIDDGASLARPGAGNWATDFFSPTNVATITSPLISDGTNLYFGGTNGAAATRIFGVQISAGVNEKTLQKSVGSAGAVTAAPAWAIYNGSTYLFVGSAVSAGSAHVYRVQVSPGALIDSDFSAATANINGGVNLVNGRAYAATDNGRLYVLDAPSFTSGGFTTLAGFPYSSVAAAPIKAYPYVDWTPSYAYFGDTAGKLYVVTATGGDLLGYPYTLPGSPQILATPSYRALSGTIAVGASDGYVYFVNRHDAANNPQIRRRYFVGTGTVSTISYNANSAQYMAATSDGHMTFVTASDVGADADGVE